MNDSETKVRFYLDKNVQVAIATQLVIRDIAVMTVSGLRVWTGIDIRIIN